MASLINDPNRFREINDPVGYGYASGLGQEGYNRGNPYGTYSFQGPYHSVSPGGYGGEVLRFDNRRLLMDRQEVFNQTVGGGGGGFGGGYNVPRINLDPYRTAELAAMERLLNLQFRGVRQELEGTIAQRELDRDFNIAQLERAQRGIRKDIQGDALSRGILDSGIFLENTAESEAAYAEQYSFEQASAAAEIGGLQSQIQLLDAQRAAQIASERAQIERAYAMARLAG